MLTGYRLFLQLQTQQMTQIIDDGEKKNLIFSKENRLFPDQPDQ